MNVVFGLDDVFTLLFGSEQQTNLLFFCQHIIRKNLQQKSMKSELTPLEVGEQQFKWNFQLLLVSKNVSSMNKNNNRLVSPCAVNQRLHIRMRIDCS